MKTKSIIAKKAGKEFGSVPFFGNILQTHSIPKAQESELFFEPNAIQLKLKIGQPDDKYEQEADHVADAVISMPDPQVQRQSTEEEEELQIQPIEEEEELQMKCQACENEEHLQKMPAIQTKAGQSNYTSPVITGEINASKGSGTPLPAKIGSEMSTKIGADFSDVSVHTDSRAVQLNQALGARAFTVGNDIFFNRNEYSPQSSKGKHLLAHELTHVIQQGHAGSEVIQRRKLPGPKCNNVEYDPEKSCCNNGNLLRQNPIENLEECTDRVPNKNRMNEYDGCSVPWWLTIGQDKDNPAGGADTHFSDTSIHGTKPQSFIPVLPCDVHDKCYQTCWPAHLWEQKWRECDERLFADSSQVCSNSNAPLPRRLLCHRAVAKARRLLPLGSWSSFVERQEEYCNCCPVSSKELITNAENVRFVKNPIHWDDDNYLISRLPKGTKVQFLDDGSGESFNDTDEIYQWWQVEVSGETGWVMQVLLEEIIPTP